MFTHVGIKPNKFENLSGNTNDRTESFEKFRILVRVHSYTVGMQNQLGRIKFWVCKFLGETDFFRYETMCFKFFDLFQLIRFFGLLKIGVRWTEEAQFFSANPFFQVWKKEIFTGGWNLENMLEGGKAIPSAIHSISSEWLRTCAFLLCLGGLGLFGQCVFFSPNRCQNDLLNWHIIHSLSVLFF